MASAIALVVLMLLTMQPTSAGKAAAWNFSSGHTFDQHLLSTLGVFRLSCYNFYIFKICRFLRHKLDGVRLIVLDDNNAFFCAYCLKDRLKSIDHIICKLQEHPVVSSQKGLARTRSR